MESVRELATRLRAAYAGVLGCDADNLALTGSTTDGVNTVLAGLDLHPGDEIITSDEEHPGLLAPLGRAKRLHGVNVRVVPFAELAGEVTASTKLIASSHVSWVSGRVIDHEALARTGVPVLLDAAQGIGAVPVDVRQLGCAFYAASGQKWLCGPEGSGCLYVREDQLDELHGPVAGLRIARRRAQRAVVGARRPRRALRPRFPARDAQRLGAGLDRRARVRRLGLGPHARRRPRRGLRRQARRTRARGRAPRPLNARLVEDRRRR